MCREEGLSLESPAGRATRAPCLWLGGWGPWERPLGELSEAGGPCECGCRPAPGECGCDPADLALSPSSHLQPATGSVVCGEGGKSRWSRRGGSPRLCLTSFWVGGSFVRGSGASARWCVLVPQKLGEVREGPDVPSPEPPPRVSSLLDHCFCDMGLGVPGQCSGLGDPSGHPVLLVLSFPLSTSCLCPSPQSLPVETLGPDSGGGPELQSAPQAPRSPFKADSEELDGAGNRAIHPPCSGVPSSLRKREAG